MLKRMMLLASMSLVAVALAAPAAVQAEWTHEGEPTREGHIIVSGLTVFGSSTPGAAKLGCQIHATVELEAGGQATVTERRDNSAVRERRS